MDRLWPRGLSRATGRIDQWARELSPSDGLRRWYAHDPARFPEFRIRYRDELATHASELTELALAAERSPLTLVFAAKDLDRSNAAVLRELLEESLQ